MISTSVRALTISMNKASLRKITADKHFLNFGSHHCGLLQKRKKKDDFTPFTVIHGHQALSV